MNFTKDPSTFLREYMSGGEEYSQSGTDIPPYEFSRTYEGGSGTGMNPYFNEQIASVPVGQDPNFRNGPLSQEDFSEMVNYGLDLKKYGPSFKAAPPASPQLPRFLKPV